jgi:PBSX family phage portal protein
MSDITSAELNEKAAKLVQTTDMVVKARVFGPDGAPPPNVASLPEEQYGSFIAAGALPPPYDPGTLSVIYESSDALQPNVTSYATNIESFGFRLEPSIDLTAPDANERIEEALILEHMYDFGGRPGDDIKISPADVEARRALLERAARIEKLQAELFFRYVATDGGSFIELRERARVDLEVTGNAYWEVIRNAKGEIAQVGSVAALTCRLMRADTNYTKVEISQKVSALDYRKVKVNRRFRRFVQIINGVDAVFFKEFEDPRVVSSKSGKYYNTLAELWREEGNHAREATEIIHFKVHSPRSAYGVPRWIGSLLAVLGSRASEEVNYLYFDNKAVPPLAVLVSGGVLAKEAVDRLKDYVNENIKGRENYHSILVIEAQSQENATASNRVQIELKPMRDAQQQDALFQTYKTNNGESVGSAFRVPRILRGQMNDFNRATAQAALEYAEKLVFQPERARFDHLVNSRLFSSMGIRFWEFVSNSPIVRDPEVLSSMIAKLVLASVLTPEEGRAIAADVFNKNFPAIDHWWVKQPPAMTIAGLTPSATAMGADGQPIAQPPADAAAAVGHGTPGAHGAARANAAQATATLGAAASSNGDMVPHLLEALRGKLRLAPSEKDGAQDEGLMQMLDALRDVLERAQMPPSQMEAMSSDVDPADPRTLRLYVPTETISSWLEKRDPPELEYAPPPPQLERAQDPAAAE